MSAINLDSVSKDISPRNPSPSVRKVLLSPKQHHMLIQSSNPTAAKGEPASHFTILETNFLSPTDDTPPLKRSVSMRQLPKTISQLINIPLGFVLEAVEMRKGFRDSATAVTPLHGEERCALAFIDRDFWVRSWSLDDAEGHCKKHFFLPQDWVNMECLILSLVTPDGRFLCPRSGEVAVMHNGLRMEGTEQV